ncbi:hypothetical protein ACLOJK_017277 [Asimina triloba]
MPRKKRTEQPKAEESSQSPEASSSVGRGIQQPVGRTLTQQQEGGGRGGGQHIGAPVVPLAQQGGHPGVYPQRGGLMPHQAGGTSTESQGRGYLPREPYGAGTTMPEAGGRGRGGAPWGGPRGGHGPSSRPSNPELHQASPATYQAAYPAQQVPTGRSLESAQHASSSSPMVEVTQQFQELAIQAGAPSQAIQPVVQPVAPSSKSVRFPLRPGKGIKGTKCQVKANHFSVELPDKNLHQYDVSITPEVTSRDVCKAIIKELVTLYKRSHLGDRLPAYDGRKSLYTAGPLPFNSREFSVTLTPDDEGQRGGARRDRRFTIVIKFAACADLHHLRLFLEGRQADAPQEALQVLDIVLRELPSSRYSSVGRSFYSPRLGTRMPLGDGLESWHGFYQSIRPTQMGLSLNIDMSSTAFIEPLNVVDFVTQLLNRPDAIHRPLSDSERVKISVAELKQEQKIKKALRGVKIEVTHRGNMRRKYRIASLTPLPTRELTFPVCKIVEGQRYSKKLNEKQITNLLKVTCQRPRERERDIVETVHQNAYHDDPYAQEFGIRINENLASVEARVLPPPRLKYHDKGKEKDCQPNIGQWNMMNKWLGMEHMLEKRHIFGTSD